MNLIGTGDTVRSSAFKSMPRAVTATMDAERLMSHPPNSLWGDVDLGNTGSSRSPCQQDTKTGEAFVLVEACFFGLIEFSILAKTAGFLQCGVHRLFGFPLYLLASEPVP